MIKMAALHTSFSARSFLVFIAWPLQFYTMDIVVMILLLLLNTYCIKC